MEPSFYSPRDMMAAHKGLGAMCGHGAFAACLGIPVVVAAINWPGGIGHGWVNMQGMELALQKSDIAFRIVGRKWPDCGLVLLQYQGPWTQPGVPARAACTKRHWVCVRAGHVWDANTEMWLSYDEWAAIAMDMLPKRATGWKVARGYEIAPPEPLSVAE